MQICDILVAVAAVVAKAPYYVCTVTSAVSKFKKDDPRRVKEEAHKRVLTEFSFLGPRK